MHWSVLHILSISGRHQVIVHCVALLQEGAESKIHAESRLHSFTKKLRHAILHNADVASAWRPAAHMRDVKATLDRKLHDQWSARAASQVAACVVLRSPTTCHKTHNVVCLLVCRSPLRMTEQCWSALEPVPRPCSAVSLPSVKLYLTTWSGTCMQL